MIGLVQTARWRGRPSRVLGLLAVAAGAAATLSVAAGGGSGSRPAAASTAAHAHVTASLTRLPLAFVPNRGQEDRRVAFSARGLRTSLFFTRGGLTISLSRGAAALQGSATLKPKPASRYAVRLDFLGASSVAPVGERRLDGIVSYFKGPRSTWRTGLPTFSQLRYPDLWPGIDIVYSGTGSRLEYSFLVKPGADPAAIGLAYRGQRSLRLGRDGALELLTPLGSFRDQRPVAFQQIDGRRAPVDARFRLGSNGRFGFALGAYDRTRPLWVDPVSLVYAGYVGGSGDDVGYGIAVDPAGSAYLTGYTLSSDFPATVGPDTSANGDVDAFVAKVKPDGSGLVYAGYLGGSSWDYGFGIAVDAAGSAYVAGETISGAVSGDFPTVVGPATTPRGGTDAFVAKLKPDGTGLVYSGYVGGDSLDAATGIAVDSAGNAYLAGQTYSDDLAVGGPDTSFNGGSGDAFVAKVKADGSGLVYAGYIGGSGLEIGRGVAVDSAGNAYVTGQTQSTDFPATVGPDTTYNGSTDDAFVAKVQADGSGLVYAGYVGGSGVDWGYGIAVDGAGSAYLTGLTTSTNFPTVVGPDTTYNGGFDAYAVKVKADGSGFDYSGYVGGSSGDQGYGIAVDSAGAAYLTGNTASANFPVTVGPGTTYNGSADAFVAKVKPDGSSLDYAGYVGGSGDDEGLGIAVDSGGSAYVVGFTNSDQTSFPALVGPDTSANGGYDAFVAKIAVSPLNHPPACSSVAPSSGLLWPPNHTYVLETLGGATDPDGDSLTYAITSVTQDEPLLGTGSGDTSPDASPGPNANQVYVRAERSGSGDGRVYQIGFTVSDGQGGSCSGVATVGVPRDQSGPAPVDSAPPSYNSFGP